MTKLPLRLAALAGAMALTAAACGGNDNPSLERSEGSGAAAQGGSPPTTAHGGEEMMPMPDFAKAFKTTFSAPASGFTVTENTLKATVAPSGFTLNCDQAGKPVVAGVGHYHLLLDKSLVNMYCTPDATVSMQNVKPGRHELEVVPAINDHAEVMEGAQTITFDYEPAAALPLITDETSAARPSIKILSPKAGETVRGRFDVVVDIASFDPSCDLFGKPGVAGYGHWHVNLDSSTGPMMGMGTMLGMSCEKIFHATTDGLNAGETHSVIALLTDNGHAPLNIEDKVEVKIG